MKFTRVVFALLMYAVSINAQIFSVQGELKDARENSKLSFGNIRVEGTSTGTAANIEGQYELRLNSGEYKLIASFIGYKSDTIKISLMNNMVVDFSLEPVSIKLDEITVVPGINPADRIIKE
ncbi:MAG: carboxypeptidase-like regulatory domain-containing protein, partial [Bacteroidetes bacterium]|nr:carboxypeptidase-like regulatory domain-containing protein [Bacteroidota bacterium]